MPVGCSVSCRGSGNEGERERERGERLAGKLKEGLALIKLKLDE